MVGGPSGKLSWSTNHSRQTLLISLLKHRPGRTTQSIQGSLGTQARTGRGAGEEGHWTCTGHQLVWPSRREVDTEWGRSRTNPSSLSLLLSLTITTRAQCLHFYLPDLMQSCVSLILNQNQNGKGPRKQSVMVQNHYTLTIYTEALKLRVLS